MRHLLRTLALSVTLLGVSEAATAITTTAANLRRLPDTSSRILGVVPGNTLLLVACRGQWCRVTYRQEAGYISRSLLRQVTGSARLNGQGTVYYRSCAAMRAAGAAPIRLGRPGYRTALDRNHNSVACDRGE